MAVVIANKTLYSVGIIKMGGSIYQVVRQSPSVLSEFVYGYPSQILWAPPPPPHSYATVLASLKSWLLPIQVLEQVSLNQNEVVCSVALKNPDKNRSTAFLPGQAH